MATTTRERLRALLATATGFYYGGTNTGTATTTVVDTGILRWDTGRLIDRWVLMTAGNNDGQSRRISAVSSSTATVGTAFSGSNANGNTFEILPFDPDIMHYALEEAMRTVWPKPARLGRAARGLYAPRTDKTLVVDNLLTGWDFEDWSSTTSNGAVATGWTDIGTPDTNQESSRIVHGSYAMKIATNANPEGIEQNIFTSSLASAVNTDQLVGKTLHVQGWVWASAVSAARIRVTYDGGSTYDNGPYHGGTSEWEGPDTQSLDSAIESGMTEIMISLEVISGNTAYFDGVVAWIDSVAEYTLPTILYPGGVHRVLQQTDESEPRGVYAPLRVGSSRAGRILRLEGIGRLSVPTTDAGTTEVDEIEGELIVAEAAMHMYRVLANTERENRAEYLQESDTWSRNAAELRESVGHGFIGADPQIGWRVSPEEARTLYVER
jgi:hypothetical protein